LVNVTSTNASHSSLNMAKNVRDRGLVPKDYQYTVRVKKIPPEVI